MAYAMTMVMIYKLKACLNRNVFSLDLKLSIEVASLHSWGSLFHNFGAECVKALSPYLADLVFGTTNISLEFDLRDLSFLDILMRSFK